MQALALDSTRGGAGRGATRRLRRPALALAAAALALTVAGDRSRAAGVPAGVAGQDPLEVLELKVRPNVILVLDSSGSMQWWVTDNNFSLNSGDHPRSRLNQAKRVLRQVVQNNQDKVSFQFGTYTQYSGSFNNQGAGAHRFQYVTNGGSYPFMDVAGTELTVRGAVGDTLGRGLQSWQLIYAEWNRLYFEESTGSICTATLPGPFPSFYASGSALATALATAMNAASCSGGRANTYAVDYQPSNGSFSFSSTGPNGFRLRPGDTPDNINMALGGLPASWGGGSGSTPVANITSMRRTTSGGRIRTSTSHSVSVGASCTVTGTSPTYWNGTWAVVSVTNSTEFFLSDPTGSGANASTIGTVTCTGAASLVSGAPFTLLYRQTGTANSGTGLNMPWKFTETITGTPTTFYHLRAGRFWNGEVIRVTSSGEVCGMDFPTAGTKTVPASLTVVAADASCNPTGDSAVFDWGGGSYTGNNRSCNGFRSKSQMIPCDLQSPPAPTQFTTISPYIDNELPLDANGDPADWNNDGTVDYQEAQDGSWRTTTINIAPSARAAGATPIANSLIDIKGLANGSDSSCITNAEATYPALDDNAGAGTTGTCVERNFARMWNTGLSTGPWASIPAAQRAIKNHADPKEKTIVIFVTDGDDTCGSRTGTVSSGSFIGSGNEPAARRAAYYAEELYRRIDAAQPASSVQTYVVGYGGSFPATNPFLLNIIAWGGSGLGQNLPGQPDVNWQSDSQTALTNARARCTTCQDAFVAPDGQTLATQLQAIIDQGASDGEFNAQQSITESVFEYVHFAPPKCVSGAVSIAPCTAPNGTPLVFDAAIPTNRYKAIVPTRFISSFTLPGFRGQQKAYQNDGFGNAVLRWSAGDVLFNQISTAMSTCNTGGQGGNTNECTFEQLIGGTGTSDLNVRTSNARIKRRIYSTGGNGVFPYTLDTLMDGTSTSRVTLWPPQAGILNAPNSITDDAAKPFDAPLGLPPDAPTSFPPNPVDPKCDPADSRPGIALPKKPYDECWFGWLQTRFQACLGSSLPAACTDPSFAVKMRAARREAREISFAFLAGAATVPSSSGAGITRTTGTVGTAPASSLLYKARGWMLADSELATAAVVTQPLPVEPGIYQDEYRLFRDGPGGSPGNGASALIKMGFGLANPDGDFTTANAPDDGRKDLKPVMTVQYAPANDMLHAFRAGPCNTPAMSVPCTDQGGEELWGFVPYDQLHTIVLRAAHEPQGKNNHVYSLARGARFADVFVPGSYTPRSAGGWTVASSNGAWRRILYIGRGIGGKYVTALDVTAPGPYTSYALDATAPVPLWSRGNPDTLDGLATGARNGTAAEFAAYAKMGETWSIPTVGLVDKTNPIYQTARRPGGVDHALFMGSGYGDTSGCPSAPCEGRTLYTLDALNGDVIATADVPPRPGFTGYPNALVANAVGFKPDVFTLLSTTHPSSQEVKRVYIGDLHGRLWKFLTKDPTLPLLAADLGSDPAEPQPVGTAVSLLGLPPQPQVPVPYILVTSGAERREEGPFRIFTFRDEGGDGNAAADFTIGAGSSDDGVITYLPVVKLFSRIFDQGTPDANCGYTVEAFFRGTVQPTAAFECAGGIVSGSCIDPIGRAFFAGTRLSLPNTKFAPITPLACGSGTYPCRSQFDSIIYALGAETGLPAYDLNASGDDAYRIFRDSRIAAITMQSDPDPARGGSSFTPDEGLIQGAPEPPPPPGVPPTSRTASRNVVMVRAPGEPAPNVRYGSTVCQN